MDCYIVYQDKVTFLIKNSNGFCIINQWYYVHISWVTCHSDRKRFITLNFHIINNSNRNTTPSHVIKKYEKWKKFVVVSFICKHKLLFTLLNVHTHVNNNWAKTIWDVITSFMLFILLLLWHSQLRINHPLTSSTVHSEYTDDNICYWEINI